MGCGSLSSQYRDRLGATLPAADDCRSRSLRIAVLTRRSFPSFQKSRAQLNVTFPDFPRQDYSRLPQTFRNLIILGASEDILPGVDLLRRGSGGMTLVTSEFASGERGELTYQLPWVETHG